MKALFVLSELPYPEHRNGIALINYRILCGAPADFEIDVVVTDRAEPAEVDALRRAAPQVREVRVVGPGPVRRIRVGNLVSGALLGVNAFFHPAVAAELRRTAGQYDVYYASPLMSSFDLRCVRPLFMNAVDSFARLNRTTYQQSGRALDAFKELLYRRYEHKALRGVAACNFVSALDERDVASRSPGLQTVCIPNGVDTEFFAPGAVPRARSTLLFTGNFLYAPNRLAAIHCAREILPRVRSRIPGVTLQIVGRSPPAELSGMDGVLVTGFVDDIRTYYQGCSVFVCPLLTGAGMKNKVLEAMACGAPVVSTPLGVEGIDGMVAGEHYLLARGPEEVADAAAQVLRSEELARALGARGRGLTTSHHSWRTVVNRYYEELSRVAGQSR